MTDKSFVYENTEVKKTGRQAKRALASNKEETLVEITPVHDRDGSWYKWVPLRVLFVVEQPEDNKNDT